MYSVKRLLALSAFSASFIIIALLTGCAQTMPEVKSGTAVPQNLVVKGIVYGDVYIPNDYYYVSQVIGPVAGAIVSLVGSYETKSTVTSDKGEYVFENVKNGSYWVQVTKEGYQQGEEYLSTEYGGLMMASAKAASVKASAVADGTIFTVDLDMWINPVMRAVTPLQDSTIETSAVFTVTFNKPMDPATIRPRIVTWGLRTSAVGDTVNATGSWDASATVLTIIPVSPLIPNEVYRLYLAASFDQVKDKEGHRLASSTSTYYAIPVEEHGNVIENNEYFTFRTSAGAAPGAPSGAYLTIGGKMITSDATAGADFADIFGAATTNVLFNPGSGNITGYKVYAANDPAKNFQLIYSDTLDSNYTTGTTFTFSMGNLLNAILGETDTSDPLGTGNYPLINQPTYFRVVAFNGEYQSAAAEVSAQDRVPPRFNANVQESIYAGGLLNNGYYLPELTASLADVKKAYVAFQEPIDPTTVSSTEFSISGGPHIVNVTLLTRGSSDLGLLAGRDYSILLVETDSDLGMGAYTLTATGIKDLAGNSMITGEGDTVVL
jgi:hypothetical protein